MTRRYLFSAAFVLASPFALIAQTPVTPADCNTAIGTFEKAALATRRETGLTMTKLSAMKADSARACLARLSPAPSAVVDANMGALAQLYAAAKDTVGASAAITRYLAQPNLTPAQLADRITAMVPHAMGNRSPSRLAEAEELVKRLDNMGSEFAVQKLAAHAPLLSYYRADDVDAGINMHALRVIALIPQLTPAQQTTAGRILTLAYTSLAEVYAGRAQADSALALLQAGKAMLAELPSAGPALNAVMERYALVGQPGAQIVGTHWFGAPPNTSVFTPGGKVTFMQFTAHWCGPCRKSYEATKRLAEKYGPSGLQVVFVTGLYGFFKDRLNITPEQELEADREYFLTEHKLPARIAVSPSPAEGSDKDVNSANYKVSGIPQIMLLDRAGKIRLIIIGWDPSSEDRLARMTYQLLTEK